MGNKVSLRDLYKVEKVVTIADDYGNEADVTLRVVPNSVKRESIDYANEKRVEMLKRLKDRESKESLLIDESLNKLTDIDAKDELAICQRARIFQAVYESAASLDEFKDIEDLENNKEFSKKVEEKLDADVEDYRKSLTTNREELIGELRQIRHDAVLNSFFIANFWEYLIFHAVRDTADPTKTYFESVEDMRSGVFGKTYQILQDEYNSLEVTGAEVKK